MGQKKRYLRTEDVCVACGAPVIPGDQICAMCQKMVDLTPGANRPPKVKGNNELKKKVAKIKKFTDR